MKRSAALFLPNRKTLASLRKAANHCEGCDLYKQATQTVFGIGPKDAPLIIVGEIPGQKEDESGIPFTGPAGTLLRDTIESAGLEISNIYFTNVVKHFKFTYMNKRKLHRSPNAVEIKACSPWLNNEIDIIQPQLILCLGAVAAKYLISSKIKIRDDRGKFFPHSDKTKLIATFHPSAILRAINSEDRHIMKQFFIKDIKKIATHLRLVN